MRIDLKSLILGAIVGGCIVIFRASVGVAKDRIKEGKTKEEV